MAATTSSPAENTTATAVHINPADVIVGDNVRIDPRLDKEFIANIKERGVIVPIVAHYDDQGRVVVVDGQRRTLAAVQANRQSIRAYVSAARDEADRIVDQMSVNKHRTGLTTSEEAKAFEQLAGLGLSAAQIAKRTATKRAVVDASLTVAASELATKAVERWDFLTLEQAAGLAEFEADAKAVEELTVAAKRGQFDHALQRLRDKRTEREEVEAFAATLAEAGVTVVDRPGWEDKKAKQLRELLDAEGKPLTPESHAGCPGHAAYIDREWEWADSDEADTDDEQDDQQDDQQDDDGQYVCRPEFLCTDYPAHGHVYRYGGGSGSKPKAADMTEKQREQAKAERRHVIESNKAWDSAEKVRREWVKAFLTRKTPPKGAALFVATSILENSTALSDLMGRGLALGWLAGEGTGSIAYAATVAKGTDARAQVVTLAYVLAGHEVQTGRHSWRGVRSGTAAYLKFLAANGYTLSDVENRAAGIKTSKKKNA